MATKKKNSYIEKPLDWLKKKIEEMQEYVDDRPVNELKDRMGSRLMKGGGQMPYVIQTIEAQRSDLSKAIIEISQMLAAVKELETAEEKKSLATRGNEELTPMESGELEEDDEDE